MIVDAERLLGRGKRHLDRFPLVCVARVHQRIGAFLVGELERAQRRIGRDVGRQLKAQFAGKERAVVGGRQRIAGRQAGDGAVEPVAGEKDIVGLVEPGEQLHPLLHRVLVIVLHLAVGARAQAPVHPAERVVTVDAHRERVVPVLVRDDAGAGPHRTTVGAVGDQRVGPAILERHRI